MPNLVPHALFEALEPKVLLVASRSIVDVDGDSFAITVIGAGDLALTTSAGVDLGFIEQLSVTNSDKNSRLNISLTSQGGGGDGRINLRGLSVGAIRQIEASAVDMLGDGIATIGDVNTLRFGNIAGGTPQFHIGTVEVLTGTRTAQFGTVGTGGTLVFNTRFKGVTFGDVEGANLNFVKGVDKVKSNGDLRASLSNGGSNANITAIEVFDALRASGIITGDVKTIKAGSAENDGGNVLDIGGSVGSIKWGGQWNALVRANYFGSFAGVDYGGHLQTRGADAKGVSLKSFKLSGSWNDGSIGLAAGGTYGQLGSYAADSCSGGFIDVGSIGTFKVAEDLTYADIDIDGIINGLSLKAFTVGGRAGGTLSVHGDAGAVKFGYATEAEPFRIFDGMSQSHHFNSISITDKTQDSRVKVKVGSLNSFIAAGGLVDSEFRFDYTDDFTQRSFKAGGTLNDVVIEAPPTYGFNALQALGILNSGVDVGFINSLTLGLGDSGGVRGSDLTFTGFNAQGYGLRAARIGETLFNSELQVNGDGKIGALTSRQYLNSDIRSGTIDSILGTGHPQAVFGGMFLRTTVNPVGGFSIKSIDLRGYVANSDIGAAGSIDKIKIHCIHTYGQEFRVSAGLAVTPLDLPADLTGFAAGTSINSIDITKSFDPNEFDFNRAFFVAPAIGKIRVNGLINLTGAGDGGQPFGFGASTFGSVSIKNTLGQVILPIIPAAPGTYNPYTPESSGNFQFQVYAPPF